MFKNSSVTKAIVVSLAMMAQGVHAANIVENGTPRAVIVLGDNATNSEKYAAGELQRAIKLMSGAELQMTTADTLDNSKLNIIIGTAKTNELIKANATIASKMSDKGFNGQEFAIQTSNNAIYLAGSGKAGALYATYEFIESLGVRWAWPGESGEFIPEKKTIPAPQLDLSRKPAFTYRGYRGRYGYDGGIWFARNRLNHGHRDAALRLKDIAQVIGFPKSWGGHSYGWITPPDCRLPGDLTQGLNGKLPRENHFEKHPEHFSLINGKRELRQQCYSNPELQQVFIEWIKAFWKENPDTEILNLAPMDNPSHCQCENCKNFASNSGTRMFKFTDIIIKAAEKEFPGKQYRTYAYSWYKGVPDCEVNENLIVEYCMYDRCYKHLLDDATCTLNSKAIGAMNAWTKTETTLSMYGYHYDAVRGVDSQYYMPMVYVIQDELKLLAKKHFVGFASELGGEYRFSHQNTWAANQIDVYVNARLQWDPNGDPKTILQDICDTVFGPASKHMQDYHISMWEAWVRDQQHVSGYFGGPAPVADFVTSEVVEKADALFSQAVKAVNASDGGDYGKQRYLKHLQLTRDVYQAWRKDGQEKKKWKGIAQGTLRHRIPVLKNAPTGEILYSEDFETSVVGQTPANYALNCKAKSERENRYITVVEGGDGRVYPNHSKFFTNMSAPKWVNYETSLKFRFQGKPTRFSLKVVVRSHGVKFIDNFRSYHVNIRGNSMEASIRPREGSPVLAPKGNSVYSDIGLSTLEAHQWHTVRIRTVDNMLFVWLKPNEGIETLVNAVELPLGGGAIAIMNIGQDAIDLDEILIKNIPDPKDLK